ncbi:MAG: hypothetical protein ACRDL3_11690 [Solirubrobacterales bacterium]
MSEELERIAERLRELAERLRDPALDDARAEDLAREAAELASRAGTEAEAALRESAGDGDER